MNIQEYEQQAVEGLRTEVRRLSRALKGMAETQLGTAPWAEHFQIRGEAFSAINQIIRRGDYQTPTPAQKIEEALVQELGIANKLAENAKKWNPHRGDQWRPSGPYAKGY